MYENIPDILTRKEAQQVLKVSKNTILNFIHDGLLPARIIGNSFRIEKDDLIEFIQNSQYYNPYR